MQTSHPLLSNQVALVTGGSGDLGRSIVRSLSRSGAKVVIHYHHQAQVAEQLAKEIVDSGASAITVQGDLAKPSDASRVVRAAQAEWGRLDILVNNAGGNKDGLLMMQSVSDIESVLDSNLLSTMICSREVIRPMIRQRSGSIINISSVSGLVGVEGQASYSAAKAGMLGFTRALAKEVGAKGVRVNAIAPGLIESSRVRAAPATVANPQSVPLKRLGTPEEVANVVLFLASDLSSYVTGAVINVSGGL